jgi:hypothetical protein
MVVHYNLRRKLLVLLPQLLLTGRLQLLLIMLSLQLLLITELLAVTMHHLLVAVQLLRGGRFGATDRALVQQQPQVLAQQVLPDRASIRPLLVTHAASPAAGNTVLTV